MFCLLPLFFGIETRNAVRAMTEANILLSVKNQTKSFPHVLANDNISFDVLAGEIHCLLGENGAGKSTLAECLYGAYQPNSGEIIFKGNPVHLTSPRDAIELGIGMVHQHFVLAPPMTVLENIVIGTQKGGFLLNLAGARQKLLELSKNYDLELNLNARVSTLSVSQQQWVEILKALYIGVELLILDEPTAVLTPQEIDKLFTILRRMRDDGISIILITHKFNEVMGVSDRITILRKGKYIGTVNTADVTPKELAVMMVGRDVNFHVEKSILCKGNSVLRMENVYLASKGQEEMLDDVSFCLCSNEILGVAGVGGNGQRALFDVITGVKKPTSGKILMGQEDVSGFSPRQKMAAGLASIPEDRIHEGLLMDFSIAENMILGRQWDSPFRSGPFLSNSAMQKFAQQSIKEYDIATDSPDQVVHVLSGGNLQKVILARELAANPKCVLASQPTRGLDVGAIEYVHNRLLELRKNGAGILLVSEDLDEIFTLADRIAVMYKGQIMGIFNAQEITREEIGLLMAGICERVDKE
jgi:simple sugar transport system ATP-binding protein